MSTVAEDFRSNGFVAVRGAVAPDVIRACVDVIADRLRARSVDLGDRATWTAPVVRIDCPEGPAFAAAGGSPRLTALYDALVGPNGWVPREGVGGTIPVRFPSATDPGDAGWHIDGSFDMNGQWWVNVHSRARALLALFLFTDVGESDAPTETIVRSHLDVPRVLRQYGERGVFFGEVVPQLPASTFERPRAFATGAAGDVFLCHPFLVHRATWPHRGTGPRIMAQPGIGHHRPFELREDAEVFPVERAILDGLV